MASISKACLELSNSIRGFRLGRSQPESSGGASGGSGPATGGDSSKTASKDSGKGLSSTSSVTNTITRAIKSATSRVKAFERNGQVQQQVQQQLDVTTTPPEMPNALLISSGQPAMNGNYTGMNSHQTAPPRKGSAIAKHIKYIELKYSKVKNPWEDKEFLSRFFWYFTPHERCCLAQVCQLWQEVLYQRCYWIGVTPVHKCRTWAKDKEGRKKFYQRLEYRGFDSICLFGALDSDAVDFVEEFEYSHQTIVSLSLRCSNITDTGLETLLDKMAAVSRLELSGCNEITEAGLWTCLTAKITSLSISDCINIADDSVGAVAQLLPALQELSLQAYHVTDNALSFFTPKQSCTLYILRLQSCWEITNHGIVNVIHSLPNLTVLSLSGCSKITDDGVELIAENLRKLRSLDLSWCPRITDAALEYIACDLGQLEELVLDRCTHITDIGAGYLSTMTSLVRLFLRWCTQIRDFGLQHLYTMKHLKVLSLAGCNQVTSSGLTGLIQLKGLEELELTNCVGATDAVCCFIKESLPFCLLIE